MIVPEVLSNGLIRKYSNANKYIVKVGTDEKYASAIFAPEDNFEFEEIDEQIPTWRGSNEQ